MNCLWYCASATGCLYACSLVHSLTHFTQHAENLFYRYLVAKWLLLVYYIAVCSDHSKCTNKIRRKNYTSGQKGFLYPSLSLFLLLARSLSLSFSLARSLSLSLCATSRPIKFAVNTNILSSMNRRRHSNIQTELMSNHFTLHIYVCAFVFFPTLRIRYVLEYAYYHASVSNSPL